MSTKIIVQSNPLVRKEINDVEIPDLWAIAFHQKDELDKKLILKTWHLCHHLKKHIQANQ